MKIGVDVRSLTSPTGRGVSHYASALIAGMAARHRADSFHLLMTGRHQAALPLELQLPNVHLTRYQQSNKLTNARLALTGRPRLDALIPGGVDVFFAPNLGFVRVSPDVPLVVTVHDLSFERFPECYSRRDRSWHRLVDPRRLLKRADRIIAVSDQTAGELSDIYGIPGTKIRTVHSGIDAQYRLTPAAARSEAARIKRKYQLPDSYFLFVGAHDPRKRLAVLLQGFVAARQQGLRAHLVLAGSVSAELLGLVRRTDEPAIHVLGYVPEADKPGLYAGALANVLVSIHEGFGFPPLEAAATGVPAIVSDLPVFTETLGTARLTVPVDDAQAIAEKAVHLERHPAERQRLAAAAKSAAKSLTWARAANRTVSVLKEFSNEK
jgi:glycosyltransferase involved in cell wall biosynthesis